MLGRRGLGRDDRICVELEMRSKGRVYFEGIIGNLI